MTPDEIVSQNPEMTEARACGLLPDLVICPFGPHAEAPASPRQGLLYTSPHLNLTARAVDTARSARVLLDPLVAIRCQAARGRPTMFLIAASARPRTFVDAGDYALLSERINANPHSAAAVFDKVKVSGLHAVIDGARFYPDKGGSLLRCNPLYFLTALLAPAAMWRCAPKDR